MNINTDTPYRPIFCGDFEVLELVCMRQHDVSIKVPGQTITGKAIDIENRAKTEFIVLEGVDKTHRIRADQIRALEILSPFDGISKYNFTPTR